MLFNSIEFLIFFPIVVLVYFVIPKKIKQLWLLVVSYYFYMCWNAKYALLILASTVITYASGLLIEKVKNSSYEMTKQMVLKKWIVAGSLVINLGMLFYFKYINFALSILMDAFAKIHIQLNIPVFDVILPVGISFYTFQALSYTMDVYRDEIYAEKNFFRYALFVSFFPQLVAGPIERSKNLLRQLAVPKRFCFEDAREGLLLMLWGFFLKIVLADRIAIFVDTVYGNFSTYSGAYLVVATMLFAIQIYCDFAGYSTIAMGSAKVLGIGLMENFDAPYLSTSVSEFWRRWHISLTSWFRDYLYIPLGGSQKGTIRKYINKMIVFLVSGLWHGAAWSALFSKTEETASIPPYTAVTRTAIVTPALPISANISAVSPVSTAVRNGKNGTTSPCHTCSKASSAEPPHSSLLSHPSFVEKLIFSASPTVPSAKEIFTVSSFSLDFITFAATVVTTASAAGTRKHAIIITS